MDHHTLLDALREDNPRALETLYAEADAVRAAHVGDAVHLRGLIELSNHCTRSCLYCGLRTQNRDITRYRLDPQTIHECARKAVRLGYGTVVLQSGEDLAFCCETVAELVRRIKAETPLAVTLSLGERGRNDLAAWKSAGADRYLLRFETSNQALFRHIHPSAPHGRDRLEMLGELRELGYEVGSGIMVGIPGQTYEDLAADLLLFQELKLDMIGLGPYLPHPQTPLAASPEEAAPEGEQVPATARMTLKTLALTRLLCPDVNLPSTTALATLDPVEGYFSGLRCGANIVMPNVTPPYYKRFYAIYPEKSCLCESVERLHVRLYDGILAMGRSIGAGRGDSPHYQRRAAAPERETAAC